MEGCKFYPPYSHKIKSKNPKAKQYHRTFIPEQIEGKAGVYVIMKKSTKEIVYVGLSYSNIYKTLYRHFQEWNDKEQERITYKQKFAYLVCVLVIPPNHQNKIEDLEQALRFKFQDTIHNHDNNAFVKKVKNNPRIKDAIDIAIQRFKEQIPEYMKKQDSMIQPICKDEECPF